MHFFNDNNSVAKVGIANLCDYAAGMRHARGARTNRKLQVACAEALQWFNTNVAAHAPGWSMAEQLSHGFSRVNKTLCDIASSLEPRDPSPAAAAVERPVRSNDQNQLTEALRKLERALTARQAADAQASHIDKARAAHASAQLEFQKGLLERIELMKQTQQQQQVEVERHKGEVRVLEAKEASKTQQLNIAPEPEPVEEPVEERDVEHRDPVVTPFPVAVVEHADPIVTRSTRRRRLGSDDVQ